jgi:ribosomal protein L16 Arg81 hydroxylase
MDFDLAKLLAPMSVEAFLRDTWEREPLVLERGDASYFRELLSIGEVDELLFFGRPAFPFAGTPADGTTPPSVVLGTMPAARGEPAVDLLGLGRQYRDGRTIYVQNFERFSSRVARLCRSLEATLHHGADAGMFLTPRGARGLPAHYDSHDVFVMQVEGEKHWRLYRPLIELPLAGRPVDPAMLGAPEREVFLRPGDLLYLPRGWIHEVFTSESVSLHLSIGVEPFRWLDLLREAIDAMGERDVRLREAIPPGHLHHASSAETSRRLRELLSDAASTAEVGEALDRVGDRFVRGLAALPSAHFVSRDEDAAQLELDASLEKRRGTVCRVREDGESASIQFPGNEIRGPRKIGPALRYIAESKRFSPRSLPEGLSDDAKLMLCRRLMREGLLELQAPHRTPS